MLVLRRKKGDAIVMNNVIRIVVLDIQFDRVKLGIEAPPDVIVVREELLNSGGVDERRGWDTPDDAF